MRVFLSVDECRRELAVALAALLKGHDITCVLPAPSPAAHAFCGPELVEALAECDGFVFLHTNGAPVLREVLAWYYAGDRAAANAGFRRLIVSLTDHLPGLLALDRVPMLQAAAPFDAPLAQTIADALRGTGQGEQDSTAAAAPACAFLPFNGLAPLTAGEAAFYCGHEALLREMLDSIRVNERRMLTLIGNPGSGRTSLVEAGLFGALQRQRWPVAPGERAADWPSYLGDSRSWTYLSMKPGSNPLRELVHCLVGLWTGENNPQRRINEVDQWAGYLRHEGSLSELLYAVRQNLEQAGHVAPWRIMLFVDRFEEIYTQARTGEGRRFAELLAAGLEDPALVVIAALGAENYGDIQRDHALFARLRVFNVTGPAADTLVAGMRRPLEMLQVAVTAPASAATGKGRDRAAPEGAKAEDGEAVEEARLQALAAAAVAHPHGLGLLRVQMSQAWQTMCRRNKGSFELPPSDAPLDAALVARADAFLARQSHLGDMVRRLILYKLMKIDAQGRHSLKRLRRAKCTTEEWELLRKMARPDPGLVLLTQEEGEPAAELVGSTLLKAWPRLEQWAVEEHDFQIWRQQVAEARARWLERGRSKAALLKGLRLYRAEHWLRARNEFVPPDDRDYVQASLLRARRQRTRRLRNLRLFAMAALVIALVAGGTAWGLRQALDVAEERAKSARAQLAEARLEVARAYAERNDALLTQSQVLADLSGKIIKTGDAVTGMLLAMEALPEARDSTRRPYVVAAEAALYQALYARRERLTLTGHSHFVSSARFRPDGRQLLSASHDKTARLWDLGDERRHHVLEGHGDKLWDAVYSPDGRLVATASQDGTARLWETRTGRQKSILKGHKGGVIRAVFGPEGKRLVTVSDDETARVWDVASGKLLHVLKGHVGFVVGAAFNHYGNRVVTSSYDKTARIWNVNNGERVALLAGHKGYVIDAQFNRDDSLVVTASYDGTARIWDAWSGALIMTLAGHRRPVYAVRFSPDGSRVLTASGDHSVRIWDAQTGAILVELQGHSKAVTSAEFSADGSRIVTSSLDQTARVWDALSGEELAVLRGHDSYVRARFSPDARQVVTASGDKTVRLWDVGVAGVHPAFVAHKAGVTAARFLPSSAQILTGARDGSAALWDVRTQKRLFSLTGHGKPISQVLAAPDGRWLATVSLDNTARIWDGKTGSRISVLHGRQNQIRLRFSPDGNSLLTFASDHAARLWETASGRAKRTFRGHKAPILDAGFAPDGETIATASADRSIRLWSLADRARLGILRGHGGAVNKIAFSPDGRLLLSASDDKTVRLWDLATGRTKHVLRGHGGSVKTLAFSPDGTRVVVASHEKTARIWDVASGRLIARLEHEFNVNGAAFSPDGGKLVTASDDGTARLWDGRSGALLATLRGHTDVVTAARFSPDGRLILTASADGRVRLWPVFATTQALLAHARTVVPRCLAPARRRRLYLLPTPPRWCAKFR